MRIFCTGASGYIGGSVAAAMVASGHEVSGLVRSERSAEQVRALGVAPVLGSLDDLDILRHAAGSADVVVNAASSDHEASALAMLESLVGTGKAFMHTSGSSIVGTQAAGHRVDDVFDEATPLKASSGRAARIALNARILGFAERSVRSVIICPSLIYGLGTGPARHSIQVPWLIALARKAGVAKHYGPGENIWANVHIADLVDLYRLALDAAPAGAFYFAENGENSMKEICEAINRTLGVAGGTQEMSLEDAAREWGEGPTQNTMGSNSRVRAVRARTELGWSPSRPSLIYEIEQGCYAESLSSGAASAR
ncbi:MAG: NAD-dependent epimerase/dehydratase family protein [Hyphomicrobiaceae bacterium]